MLRSLVGSEMCIRDRVSTQSTGTRPSPCPVAMATVRVVGAMMVVLVVIMVPVLLGIAAMLHQNPSEMMITRAELDAKMMMLTQTNQRVSSLHGRLGQQIETLRRHAKFLDERLRIASDRQNAIAEFVHSKASPERGVEHLAQFRKMAQAKGPGVFGAREVIRLLQHERCEQPLLFALPTQGGFGSVVNNYARVLSLALLTGRVLVPTGAWGHAEAASCPIGAGWSCFFNVSSCFNQGRMDSAIYVDHRLELEHMVDQLHRINRDMIIDVGKFPQEYNMRPVFLWDEGQGNIEWEYTSIEYVEDKVGLERPERMIEAVGQNLPMASEIGRLFGLHVGQVHGLLVEAVTVLNSNIAQRLAEQHPELLPTACSRMAECSPLPHHALHVRGTDFGNHMDERQAVPDGKYMDAVDMMWKNSKFEQVFVASDTASRNAAYFQEKYQSSREYSFISASAKLLPAGFEVNAQNLNHGASDGLGVVESILLDMFTLGACTSGFVGTGSNWFSIVAGAMFLRDQAVSYTHLTLPTKRIV
eukprot:TRINITY_DN26537_c0_g1_i1.p1 TRINITY_DN26537_c0_g1~~TRINITY_DN26537_c0_g1_i1.p1  ORF type:complete len:530 (-),score=94.30 TRINITY_DN26537_c0_g1_i1:96-1685(-)